MVSQISFPGFGIDEFYVDRIAFTIKGTKVSWYGMIICLGIILGFSYFCYRAAKAGLPFDSALDFALIVVPLSIIGARLYYVIFDLGQFHSFKDVIAIWNGGLAIYGGVIGGAIAFYTVCRVKKLNFFKMADMVCPGLMIGQLIGRWGNFINGEAFGGETTLPWRMGVNNKLTGFETLYVHPTFLYESLWNLLGLIIANEIYKKKKFHGEVMVFYFMWYGLGRMFIEQLRTDSLYIGNTNIRVSALLAALCFIVFLPIFIFALVSRKKLIADGKLSEEAIVPLPEVIGLTRKNFYETLELTAETEFSEDEVNTNKDEDAPTPISGKILEEGEKDAGEPDSEGYSTTTVIDIASLADELKALGINENAEEEPYVPIIAPEPETLSTDNKEKEPQAPELETTISNEAPEENTQTYKASDEENSEDTKATEIQENKESEGENENGTNN